MKVKTLKLFNDLQSKKLRKVNEIFEVTANRVEKINSTPYGALVEVIEEDKKVEEKANPIKPKSAKKK